MRFSGAMIIHRQRKIPIQPSLTFFSTDIAFKHFSWNKDGFFQISSTSYPNIYPGVKINFFDNTDNSS